MLRQHLPSLDGIRGLAILMVIAHNVQMFEPAPSGLVNQVAMYVFNFGWMGVQLFFVLSGFLITGILLDTQDQPHPWRNFAARRVLRIFPLYYATLLLIFVVLPVLGWQPHIYQLEAQQQWWHWLYLSNWAEALHPDQGHYLPHLWSLAVEEQFYLLWPLVLMWKSTPRQVLVTSLVLALVSLMSRMLLLHEQASSHAIYVLTPCRMDALTLGAAAAAALRIPTVATWLKWHHPKWLAGVISITALVFIVSHGFPRNSPFGQTWGYSTLAVLFAALVTSAALKDIHQHTPSLSVWRLSILRTVGTYSYGMYIIHKPLHDLFSKALLTRLHIQPSGSVLWAGVHVLGLSLASFAAAFVSYHALEKHFLKLKRHFT